MAQTITNQASLNYQYNGQNGSAVSNIATAALTDPISADKNSLEQTYTADDEITFAVSFINSSQNALTDITVTDNLGTYAIGGINVTPLNYVDPAMLYINGVYSGPITPMPGINSISFDIASLAAGANALIVYKTITDQLAPLAVGSQITNTVTIDAAGLNEPVTAANTITVEEYAQVSVTKTMSPASIVDGATVTYTFTVYNYGNTQATDIVLTDAFNPAPTGIAVQVDGVTVAPANYTYTAGTLTLPTGGAYTLSLPAATITQDSTTGVVSVVPSSMTITVTGTL